MNRIKLIAIALIGTLFSQITTLAQHDAKSKQVLEAMSKHYQSQTAFKLQFQFQAAKASPSKGELAVKGDKYFLKLSDQEVYNDGKAIYTYLKESKEVTIQDAADEEFSSLSPTKIFSSYQKGYKSSYAKTRTEQGTLCDVVVLQPTDKNSPLSKVELAISQKDASLKSWKITEKNGNTTNYAVLKVDSSTGLTDADFKFNEKKYPGIEVVDLR